MEMLSLSCIIIPYSYKSLRYLHLLTGIDVAHYSYKILQLDTCYVEEEWHTIFERRALLL